MPPSAPRSRRLPAAPGLSATLTYYPPGTEQAAHDHDFTQISYLLAGELNETLGHREFDLASGHRGCKPAGARHANRFGRHGAVIFAIAMREPPDGPPGDAGWSRGSDAACIAALVRTALETGDRSLRADALQDLAALTGHAPATRLAPPPWLARVREQIRDAPGLVGIAVLAQAAGIDRTRLSRAFHQYYGVPPSVYRLRCMTAKAISAALASGSGLADAAHAAGFADQSHLARAVKSTVGVPLQGLRALLD